MKKTLSVPEKHQLKIARSTLKMHDVGAAIMGGMTKDEARQVILRLTGKVAKKATVISERFYNQDQSWFFERTTKFESTCGIPQTVKLKTEIRRNAYDCQSYARVFVWNGSEWKLVLNAPITHCECVEACYTSRTTDPKPFVSDHYRYTAEALEIVWS